VSERPHARDVVAVVLAVSLGLAVNFLMFAVLWDALRSDTPGLSENATQVIIAAFGGIVGILGGYLGGRAVERAHEQQAAPPAQTSPAAPGSSLPGDPPRDAQT
jgi:predicted MFS family arabinose efflux permease